MLTLEGKIRSLGRAFTTCTIAVARIECIPFSKVLNGVRVEFLQEDETVKGDVAMAGPICK